MSNIDVDTLHFDFLIDTNIFITAEPAQGILEPNLAQVAQFLRISAENRYTIYRHPSTRLDILNDKNVSRRQQRLAELEKYAAISAAPISASLKKAAGDSKPGTNDHIDLELLAALDAGAVTHLITQDIPLHKRARRAGLGGRVLTVSEAIQLLQDLTPVLPAPPPRVDEIKTYELDIDDPIFDSLRIDYTGFDDWLSKVRREHKTRACFVIRSDIREGYAGLALLKQETSTDFPAATPALKISTFKVDAAHAGMRYGELLLKSVMLRARETGSLSLYVEVFEERQPLLVQLLTDFGFSPVERRTVRGEATYAKELTPDKDAQHRISPLEYNRLFGPGAIKVFNPHLVPIQPRWHRQLFPDFDALQPVRQSEQFELFDVAELSDTKPWGNALRKAYLCKSASRNLSAGTTLLFYRSGDYSAVTAVGITEEFFRTADPQELAFLIGKRTVYTAEDIKAMASTGNSVLAILFRQDRVLELPWTLPELRAQGVVHGPPQSITKVATSGGVEWVRRRLQA